MNKARHFTEKSEPRKALLFRNCAVATNAREVSAAEGKKCRVP
jgi:hypothetical protein